MKKLVSIALASVLSLAALTATGCGEKNKEGAGDPTTIEITFWRSGMGDAYMGQIVKAFEAKYPEYTVEFNSETTNTAIPDNIMNGAKYNSVDLYFEVNPSYSLYEYLEPLDDVLNMVNSGESKTVSQKISKSLLDNYVSYDGKYYTLPYGGGVCGIVYNVDLMGSRKLPNTTDELRNLVFDLYSAYDSSNCKPFIYFNGGYWEYVYNIWHAQYDGLDYYYNTYSTLGQSRSVLGTVNENPSKEVLTKKDGRFKALQVLETLLNSQYIVAGSNSSTHTDAQTKFINGRAVMMCNGAWMNNEMKTATSTYKNFSIMKTPVISAITENLTDVKTDALLSATIDVVDKVVDGEIAESSVKQSDGTYLIGTTAICASDWNRIYEARTMIWENYSQHGTCIPNYSDAKEGAKKFIAFYYSDEAQKIMNNETHMSLPFTFDNPANEPNVDSWSIFEKTMYEFSKKYTTVGLVDGRRSLVFTAGGAGDFGYVNFVGELSQQQGAKTAEQVWAEIVEVFNTNWSSYTSR
ncbi:MAG: extracellular solute-binding protein [Clostridia bacterium]|nr:extracellular solute-binding protein [Clostridia bacterium]